VYLFRIREEYKRGKNEIEWKTIAETHYRRLHILTWAKEQTMFRKSSSFHRGQIGPWKDRMATPETVLVQLRAVVCL